MRSVLLPLAWLPAFLIAAPARSEARGWIEYEAERQVTSGKIIGPDRTYGTLVAEASGRQAVELENAHQSVEITLAASANALTLRYSLPASSRDGRAPTTAIIEANGQVLARVSLLSGYSFGNATPPPHPASHRPIHHYWDEVRVRLPHLVPRGTRMTVRMASTAASPFAIDLVDAERVPVPALQPRGAISVVRFGADPSGQQSSLDAFNRALEFGRKFVRTVYVPPGHYQIDGHIIVDHETIVGAGSWHSILSGHNLGFYSLPGGSSLVSLSGLAIESDVASREDTLPLAAIGGTFSNSNFQNLYLHHAKVGLWLDGPAHDLAIMNVEIADQAADGINLHRGIRNARVENNRVRNTGDDGIASWSDGVANDGIVIRNNRISSPTLANGIAIYGGRNVDVTNNLIADVTVEGGGIHLGTRFHSAPFSGTIFIRGNRLIRTATLDPNWHFGVGAIWIYALEQPINANITISNNQIVDAGCEAVQLIGPNRIDGLRIEHLAITGSASSVFAIQAPGSMVASNVIATLRARPTVVELPPSFRLVLRRLNRGWIAHAVPHPRPPQCL